MLQITERRKKDHLYWGSLKTLLVLACLVVTVFGFDKVVTYIKSARAGNTVPVQPLLINEGLETPTSLSNFAVVQNPSINNLVTIDSTRAHSGSKSLLLNYNNYTNNQHVGADMKINSTPQTNILVRTYFYDDMSATKGNVFGVATTGTANTGIGLNTNMYPSDYLFRVNTPSNMFDSNVKRSLGWHLFELIVTDKGTYGKIDNSFLYKSDRTLFVNPDQTNITMARYVSTWGLYGKAWYDDLQVVAMDQISPTDSLYRTLQTFYNTYKYTNFSPLYPQLNIANPNDIRSLLDTACVFYVYGKYVSDQNAINLGITELKDALINGHWNNVPENNSRHWVRGITLGELAYAGHLMWNDLDTDTQNTLANTVNLEAQKFILAQDNFEDPALSGWEKTVTGTTNKLSIQPGVGISGSNGVLFNYVDAANYIMLKKHLQTFPSANPSSPSLKASIWFYDDMSPQKGTLFSISSSISTPNTGLGVMTIVSPNYYVFRNNAPNTTIPTRVLRTKGWHLFELTLSSNTGWNASVQAERIGVIGYIDNQQVAINNSQVVADYVNLISTWGLTGNSIYDNLQVTRMPDTGKTYDTKSEENAWNASGLTEAVNYFPAITNSDILKNLADCYAFHSLTTSADTGKNFCHTQTITESDNYQIQNHGLLNPSYQASPLALLTAAIISFKNMGITVPPEYLHNYQSTFNSLMTFIDPNAFQFIRSPQLDWSGVTNSPYQTPLAAILFAKSQGWAIPFDVNDFMRKRHIFFYNMVSNVVDTPPIQISVFNQVTQTDPSYKWFLDSVVGNVYMKDGLNYSIF